MARIVLHAAQAQAIGREGGRRQGAVARLEDVPHPARWPAAGANVDQTPDDVAHHVMQKGIGTKIEAEQPVFDTDVDKL